MANERPVNWVIFCKRTNFPKLGYIIHKLNKMKVPCIIRGESWHAPVLCVPAKFLEKAETILDEPFGDSILDEIPDDSLMFKGYMDVKPHSLKGGI